MKTLTFEDIHARVAQHQAAEAMRNAPVAVARRAVFELSSVLGELTEADRADVLALLRDELAAEPIPAR